MPSASFEILSMSPTSSDVLATLDQNLSRLSGQQTEFPKDWVIAIRLMKLVVSHATSIANAWLKVWHVSYPEYLVMTTLYGSEGQAMPVAALSRVLGEPSSHTTRLLHLLGRRGLIVRRLDESDRRKVIATLSEEGARLVQAVLPALGGMLGEHVRAFEPGELPELLRLLKKTMQGLS
jgi:MarR family transcriptional regulator, negative regulator of the multidrug operon emrRAB